LRLYVLLLSPFYYCIMNFKESDLHIWRYELDEEEYHLEKTEPMLSAYEQARCKEYMNEAEKIRYTCNHRFVRRVLATYLNMPASAITFSQAPMGKPFVKGSSLYFNYSYRTTFGLLAVSKHQEIGVDIERMKPLQDTPTFASFSFSEKEKEIIFGTSEERFQETLFTFWTFKEAIIKALGVGLNADLTQIDLSDFFYSNTNPLSYDDNAVYTIQQINALKGYKAAFAIKGAVRNYSEFNFNELFKNSHDAIIS
jgi:4'-phosphopantetheinyl transferase